MGTVYCIHAIKFLEMAHKNDLTDIKPGPVFDFQLDYIMSIVTSGHKWVGVPWPCGRAGGSSFFLSQAIDHFHSALNDRDGSSRKCNRGGFFHCECTQEVREKLIRLQRLYSMYRNLV